MLKNILGAMFLVLSVGACAANDMKLSQREAADFGLKFIALLQTGNIAAIEAHIDPAVLDADPHMPGRLQQVAKLVPLGKPASIAVTSWRYTESSRDGKYSTLVFQLEFPPAWLIATMVFGQADGRFVVKGLTLETRRESLQQTNAFSLRNKPFLSYVFLAYAIWVPCIIVYALISCIQTPMENRKWLWIIFILLGNLGNLTLNWTTGAFSYQVLWVHLPASAYHADAYNPVFIASSLPVGALVFLNRRRRGLFSKKSSPSPDQPPAAPPAQGAA